MEINWEAHYEDFVGFMLNEFIVCEIISVIVNLVKII